MCYNAMQSPTGRNVATVSPQPQQASSTRRIAATLALAALLIAFIAGGALMTTRLRFYVHGFVVDALSGAPLSGVLVSAGDQTAYSDERGMYDLPRSPTEGQFTFALDGYKTARPPELADPWLTPDIALDVALQPVVVTGTVTDAASGTPVAGAVLDVGTQTVEIGAGGAYTLLRVKANTVLTVRAAGYDERTVAWDGEAELPITMEQNTVAALVVDERDGRALAHARLAADGQDVRSADAGRFILRGVTPQTKLTAEADGFLPAVSGYAGGAVITVALTANTVEGTVRDSVTGAALTGITITLQQAGQAFTTTTNAGGFRLRAVRTGAAIGASGPSHETAVVTYTGQASLALALRPDTLSGVVRNSFTQAAMSGVTITLQHGDVVRSARSDATGVFGFTHVPLGAQIAAAMPNHATAVITYTGQPTLAVALRPNTLRGVVRDGRTGAPIAGAQVSVGAANASTAADGSYSLAGIPGGLPLVVNAAGFDRTPVTIGPLTTLDVRMHAGSVRAIYIPFYLLTAPNRVRTLIAFAAGSGMNGIVVDVKADDGYIAYASALPLAREIGAQWPGDMMRLDEVLALAKQHGLYTIARMVVFKDNLLATERPDLAVKDKRTGQVWDDCGNGSTYWADPYHKDVVAYNVGIAEEAARMGFDEIQFDYIRFPPACVSQGQLENALYSAPSTVESRVAAIATFLSEARQRLKPMGVAIAVDTFGWTLLRNDDMAIGQHMETMAQYVDYICPMVYPSTWEDGALGLEYPPAQPYELVYRSLTGGLARLKDIPGVRLRPWLQDFNDYRYRELSYGLAELDAQRRATQDAGGVGWMLWNAGGEYTEETAPRP